MFTLQFHRCSTHILLVKTDRNMSALHQKKPSCKICINTFPTRDIYEAFPHMSPENSLHCSFTGIVGNKIQFLFNRLLVSAVFD